VAGTVKGEAPSPIADRNPTIAHGMFAGNRSDGALPFRSTKARSSKTDWESDRRDSFSIVLFEIVGYLSERDLAILPNGIARFRLAVLRLPHTTRVDDLTRFEEALEWQISMPNQPHSFTGIYAFKFMLEPKGKPYLQTMAGAGSLTSARNPVCNIRSNLNV
jgi:hypothetical protein